MLAISGVLYNLGVWIDKYLFWFNSHTGSVAIGILHHSVIYDLPIFLAYLSIIPGMAVFLVRMETDFVEHYHDFYDAVCHGGTLARINVLRNRMTVTARQGIFDIMKIQGLTIFVVFIAAPSLLKLFGLPLLYLHLFYIDLIGAGLQVVFIGLLNVMFYFDKRMHTVILTGLFVILNFSFSLTSIYMGPFYFGYGFVLALLLCNIVGMILLNRTFDKLIFTTFTRQG